MVDQSVAGLVEQAQHLVRAGQPNQARAACLRVLEAFPRQAKAFGVLGQAYLSLGQDEHAADAFFRVLGVYPNDPLANASLAAIYDTAQDSARALWYLERAFEMAPANAELQQELLRLYQTQGIVVDRVQLTRVGLARTYMRGLLYSRAERELKSLASSSDRSDVLVSLLECYWHLQDASNVAALSQRLLVFLPDCLMANLLLGNMWLGTSRDDEGRVLLERAQSLDPDNEMAQFLFGARSPLPPRRVRVPSAEEELVSLDLDYLADDSEAETDDSWVGWSESGLTSDVASDDELLFAQQSTSPPEIDPGLSITDIQRMYVNDHPDDWQARLDLARRYRDEKSISLAIVHYGHLVVHNRELLREIIGDLEFLIRRFPEEESLSELLVDARTRQRRYSS